MTLGGEVNTCADAAEGDCAPPSLLLVDDEANILASLRRLFRPQGYRVLTAESGQQGLEVLDREQVDVIISDMRMPGMSGAEFLTAVRMGHPRATRILLTGFADMGTTIEAINKGELHRYISKPWDDRELLLVVREAVERQQLQREKARLEALTQQQNEELKALNSTLEAKVEARTVELRDAHEKLKAGFLNSIRLFSNLIELRGGALAGHSRRVADHARRVGQAMNLDTPELQDLFFAGLLHDVGKIGLSDKLLVKAFNSLTAEERGEVVRHPAKGEALLMGLEQLRGAAKLIRSHHEHFDGSGYPDRLTGYRIPLGARILTVANDFDAIQQGAIWTRRATVEEALAYVQAGRGKRYDPQVVDAFLALHRGPPAAQESMAAVQLSSDALVPGMVLARDLVTDDGVLLLARDYVLDARVIAQVRSFEESEGRPLKFFVLEKRR